MRVHRRVGTCTFDFSTKIPMKASREGRVASFDKEDAEADRVGCSSLEKVLLTGVAGGDWRGVGADPHWITSIALAARCAEEGNAGQFTVLAKRRGPTHKPCHRSRET